MSIIVLLANAIIFIVNISSLKEDPSSTVMLDVFYVLVTLLSIVRG
jgi:hypothetical protein